jgi:hypothetical protein
VPRLRRALPTGALVAALVLVGGCASGEPDEAPAAAAALPERVAPETARGYALQRALDAEQAFAEPGDAALVGDGRVFTVRDRDGVHAYLQVAAFDADVDATKPDVRNSVLSGIGAGQFDATRLGGERVFEFDGDRERYLAWFAPHGGYFQLLVARPDFDDAGEVFLDVLAHQRGDDAPDGDRQVPTLPDPRRGGPQ